MSVSVDNHTHTQTHTSVQVPKAGIEPALHEGTRF